MDDHFLSAPFELTGSFGGFVFTDAGKRRLRLHMGEQEYLLKVPRILRRRIIGKFRVGEPIRVGGTEERDIETGTLKRLVSQVVPDETNGSTRVASPLTDSAPIVTCPIRVCSKKNCWRNGGRELWHALGQELDARNLTGQIELQQVGCLDRCKRAPNVDWGDHEFTHCSPGDATAIIARAAGEQPRAIATIHTCD